MESRMTPASGREFKPLCGASLRLAVGWLSVRCVGAALDECALLTPDVPGRAGFRLAKIVLAEAGRSDCAAAGFPAADTTAGALSRQIPCACARSAKASGAAVQLVPAVPTLILLPDQLPRFAWLKLAAPAVHLNAPADEGVNGCVSSPLRVPA